MQVAYQTEKAMDDKRETLLPQIATRHSVEPAIVHRRRLTTQARNWTMLLALSSGFCLWQLFSPEIRGLFESRQISSDIGIDPPFKTFDAFRPDRLKPKDAEKLFLSVPSPESALKTSRDFSDVPHVAGSAADFEQAKAILKIFQDNLGISSLSSSSALPIFEAGSTESRTATLSITNVTSPQAWVDTYYPVMNLPLERELQILNDNGTAAWSADVEEEEIEGDDAGKYAKTIGAWHGLSKAGDVKGKLVYVNYGSKEDYDLLAAKGVNLTGAIAIARYGGLFRGLKVKGAQEAGAIGCLIYSDPRDDGTVIPENGYAPYPAGPARNPTSVQRGSVQFLSKYPGDPSTPGYPSYKNATRSESLNVPSIPSLPISWFNAKTLLAEISENFNFTLDGARSQRDVRLNNQVHTDVFPIWNAMAVVPGHVKSEVVLLGCHRDAWVLGAGDPISGTTAIVEIVKGLGALMKKGWRPLRTLVIASWDAEEPGLIGSTEYGEDFEEFLREHIVAYLNVDVATKGSRFAVGGSPTLAHLLRQAAIDIPHPTEANRTLWDARTDKGKLTGPPHAERRALEQGIDWQNEDRRLKEFDQSKPESTSVRPLGSGSDYTVFLQRIGIASSDEGFTGTLSDPVYPYHSVYDSQRWQEIYADPGFLRHVAIAKHLGLVALRLLDTPLLPLNTTQYALELGSYYDIVNKEASAQSLNVDLSPLAATIRDVQSASAQLDKVKVKAVRRLEKAIADLEKHSPHLDNEAPSGCHGRKFEAARKWVKRSFGVVEAENDDGFHPRFGLAAADTTMGKKKGKIPKRVRKVMEAAAVVVAINKKLSTFERGFISPEGIKDREWYRNLVVAPGKWTGYGATTFPGLSEAINIEHDPALVKVEMHRLADLFSRLADSLEKDMSS